jgi:hypothetical protein
MAFTIRRTFYLAIEQLGHPACVEGADFNQAAAQAAKAEGNEWNEVEIIGYPYYVHWIQNIFEQFLTANLQVHTPPGIRICMVCALTRIPHNRSARRSAWRSSTPPRPSTGATMSKPSPPKLFPTAIPVITYALATIQSVPGA